MTNRIQIVNWRQHGDDESYVRIEVLGEDNQSETAVIDMIEADHEVESGAEDRGDYEHTYYVNDDITIHDGQVMTNPNGQQFLISIRPVEGDGKGSPG